MIRLSHSAGYKDFRSSLAHAAAAGRGRLRSLTDRQVKSIGRNQLLLGSKVRLIFNDPASALILDDSGASPRPEGVYAAAYPCAASLGIAPGWRSLNPPTEKATKVSLNHGSTLRLYENTRVCPGVYISAWKGAEVSLGSGSYIGHETQINSGRGVSVGRDTLIGHGVLIMDYDGHPILPIDGLQPEESLGGAMAAVEIGDRVWVGHRSVILKGVKIGSGSIIGTGSIVTGEIPPDCVAAGNPARVIKEGVTWKRA